MIHNQIQIFEEFKSRERICITGVSGIGKSTLAIEFGHYRKDAFVCFFKADTELKVKHDYEGLAKQLQIKEDYEDHRIRLVNDKLNALAKMPKEIIFIFDNVENYDCIEKYLRNLHKDISVLVTVKKKETVQREIGDGDIQWYNHELKPFSLNESKKYILDKLKDKISEPQIKIILEKIGKNEAIPFHLNKVVSILLTPFQPIEKSVETIIQQPDKWVQTAFFDGFMGNTMVSSILEYIPYFDPDSIDLNLLAAMIDPKENEEFFKALEILEKNVLIKNEENREISVHRLLQNELTEYFKVKLKVGKINQVRIRFTEVIEAKFEINDFYSRNLKSMPFAHADRLIQKDWFDELQDNEIKAKLFKKMGIFCWHVQTGMLMSSFLQNSLNIKKHFIPGKMSV